MKTVPQIRSVRRAGWAWILQVAHQKCHSFPSPHVSIGLISNKPHNQAGSRLFFSSESSFTPPPPPSTFGTPVFPDIDFSIASRPNSDGFLRNNDYESVFVVTGASRGIGLQFVKTLVNRTKGSIVACCRSPQDAIDLNNLVSTSSGRVEVLQLDLENQDSIERAGEEIRAKYGRVDVLLNVAGILGNAKTTPGPERSLSKIDRGWFATTLAVNLVGPVMFTKELAPLMMHQKKRQQTQTSDGTISSNNRRPASVVVNMSARVGSISDNSLGGWYSYRISKAGLNQATRTLALELKRHSVWCISCHPGTTNTDLSQPFQGNVKEGSLFPVDFTVSQLLHVIDSLTEANSGGFYDWAGKSISF